MALTMSRARKQIIVDVARGSVDLLIQHQSLHFLDSCLANFERRDAVVPHELVLHLAYLFMLHLSLTEAKFGLQNCLAFFLLRHQT